MQLVKGANAPLMSPVVTVTVTGDSLDLCALLVTAAGRVRSDADLVFFNEPTSPCGQVRLLGTTVITANLTALPSDVATVVIAAALDEAAPGGFGALLPVIVTVQDGARGLVHEVVDVNSERCVVLVELYRRAGIWKVRAVSQGWNSGLAGLVTQYGVAVDEQRATPAAAALPAAGPPPATPGPLSPLVSELHQRLQAGLAARRTAQDQRPWPAWRRPPAAARPSNAMAYKAARRAEAVQRTGQLQATLAQLDAVLTWATVAPDLTEVQLLALIDASVPAPGVRRRLFGRRTSTPQPVVQPATHLAPVLAEIRRRAGTLADPEAIAAWVRLGVLVANLPAPLGQVEHVCAATGRLVVDVALADRAVIPAVHKAKYVATTDQLADVVMPARERAMRTERLFAAAVLAQGAAAAHACAAVGLPADLPLVVNSWEWAVNPATGRPERVCRGTVATTPAQLTGLALAHVEPVACLRGLRGQVSEDRPVPPVAQRSGRRTVAGTRLDLAVMDPFAFEQLIADLAEAMGYSAERTARSGDGGVDVYVRSNDPLTAGTVVISAKRYARTVDVHYVRELAGVVNHEGAIKGLLITTSGFGASAYQWARGKPLQLVDGQQLREWLATYLDINAQ